MRQHSKIQTYKTHKIVHNKNYKHAPNDATNMYDTASFILSLVEVGLTRAFIVYVRPLEKDSIYFKHRKYQNLFAFSFMSAEYLQKMTFLFPKVVQ